MALNDYEPAPITVDTSLSLDQAVRASAASLRDALREITGSEPIVETVHCSSFNHYVLATYGAGKYAVISRFSMNQLPGCCGVVVFYHASVALDFRGRGLGSLLLRLREEAARKAGFTLALATVEGNEEERSILEKAGWKQLESFNDHRTGNQVILYGRLLF